MIPFLSCGIIFASGFIHLYTQPPGEMWIAVLLWVQGCAGMLYGIDHELF